MTKLVAISKQTHTQKVWRRPADYRFAARDPLTPIVVAEIGFVGSWMPIAFVEQAGCFVPMAMMSPVPEQNLFVGPDGKWLGGYIPASVRGYPFRLLRSEGSGQMTLCVDEDSGLVVDSNGTGEAFFTGDGKPSESVSALIEFLRQIEGSRVATELAMASLAEAGLIESWPLELEVDGKKAAINGLLRVNEQSLNRLDDEAFLKLRKTSALNLAYVQIMSMGQIARFQQLMQFRQQIAQAPKIKTDELFKIAPDESIRFDN
jgi:hypothetical protein